MRAHDVDHRRNRHGNDAVLAAHRTLALRKLGNHYLVSRHIIKTHSEGKHIGNGIHRAYLMEMNLIDRLAMGLRLGLGNDGKNIVGDALGVLGSARRIDDGAHIGQVAMLMMMPVGVIVRVIASAFIIMAVMVPMAMIMVVKVSVVTAVRVIMVVKVSAMMVVAMIMLGTVIMLVRMSMLVAVLMIMAMPVIQMPVEVIHVVIVVLVRGIEHHVKITGIKARLLHTADANLETLHGKTSQNLKHELLTRSLLLGRAQIKKRSDGHVAAYARTAFEVQGFRHLRIPSRTHARQAGTRHNNTPAHQRNATATNSTNSAPIRRLSANPND